MISRSTLSPRISCCHASPGVPTTAVAGTATSVKNTSLHVCASIVSIPRISIPAASVGTMSSVSPWCLAPVESSRASTSMCSARCAAEIHVFCPLIT